MPTKSFPDAVDAAIAFLYKKRKPDLKAVLGDSLAISPKTTSVTSKYELPEPSKKVVRRALAEGNPPDFGDTQTKKYSGLEKNVQRAELADALVSNAAFVADIAGKVPKLAKAARVVSGAGKVAAPAQAALWMLDSARATADPEYRAETEKAVTENLESGSNPFVKQLRVAASTVARPVSTIRGMLDSLSEADTRRINAELRDQPSQRRMKDLQDQRQLKAIGEAFERARSEAEVPEVDIRQGDKQRTERAARKFFK